MGFSRRGTPVKPARPMSPEGTHFVIFSTWQRRRLFVVESYPTLTWVFPGFPGCKLYPRWIKTGKGTTSSRAN